MMRGHNDEIRADFPRVFGQQRVAGLARALCSRVFGFGPLQTSV